jgi:parallel beta-helix repeat protein
MWTGEGDTASLWQPKTSAKHNIKITGITFDGNNASQTWDDKYYLLGIMHGSNNVTVRDCSFKHATTEMIWIGSMNTVDSTASTSNHVLIENCNFNGITRHTGDYPAAVYMGGSYCTVRNCHIANTWWNGIVIQDYDQQNAKYNTIDNNYFIGHFNVVIYSESGESSNTTITNNWIVNPLNITNGVFANGIWANGDCYVANNHLINFSAPTYSNPGTNPIITLWGNNNKVINNIIVMLNNSGIQHGDGIYINYGSDYTGSNSNMISGNEIYNCQNGIVITNSAASTHLQISDNLFYNCRNGTRFATGQKNITFTDNRIINFVLFGIYTSSIMDSVITDNVFKGSGTGIRFVGSPNYNVVTGNILSLCTTPLSSYYPTTTNLKSDIRDNLGYITESWGLARIAAGGTSIVVNHNLSATPTYKSCNPDGNITYSVAIDSQYWWIDTVTTTQFTIHLHYATVASVVFDWYAKV